MPRYIDADRITYYPDYSEVPCGEVKLFTYKEDIDNMPTADVQKVKHGKWIKDEYGDTVCSCCYQCVAENEGGYPIQELKDYTPQFCPNCGAKMDLGG